jgi:phosphate transport system substrate-binding protein
MKRVSTALAGIFLITSAVWGQDKATTIRIEGSLSMLPCAQRLVEWYHHNHPNASFTVEGGGVTKAIAALIAGKADIVQSSRKVLGGEIGALRDKAGKRFVQIPVATEVAGILVHPSNPIRELSIFDLRRILSGAVKNWKQVGGNDSPIQIYGRNNSSDIREFIEEEFMGDASIAASAITFPKNAALYAAVASDKNGIGFGSINPGLNPSVRFLAIKPSASEAAVAPTTENIREHRYPLVRPLYFIFAGEPSGELQRFGEWALSGQGQLVVEAAELWPLGPADREQGKTLLAAR